MLEIFLVQMEVAPNDKAKNFAKVEALTQGIRMEAGSLEGKANAGLIVLPEMFATGYLPLHPESAAEDFSCDSAGETAHFLHKLANRTGCAVMGAGISGADAACVDAKSGVRTVPHCDVRTAPLTNHASIYMPGNATEYAGYDKRRPFFMEQGKFRAGDNINLFKINEWTIAPTICFDLRFPELYRDAVKAGANLFTVQAAWPEARINHWNTLLKARAIENQAYVAAVNCVSPDGKYTGNSQIINPQGEVIAQAEAGKECVISASFDMESLLKYRKVFPVLKEI
ncbi:nitrilase-related carbon-nitrogen hydrolase [Fibrobacter sp. UWT3]|uniref:nitrilase-related carbon-nitrogen hydrolase n=1 Tax=Fibrobacter sp. UWT3 TaxID=1896225 RepID=UPI000BE3BE0B|nr:nitrilase-related carbon-nitrogen hydrolase [Fibrobacter sp. UWT3]